MVQNRPITVGIVEDHDALRNELAKMLEACGFKVIVCAENGKDFLEQLKQDRRLTPHVCLLDITMPVMNGFDTARELFRAHPYIKILGHSFNMDNTSIVRMIQNGACGFFYKGQSLQDLRHAIESAHTNGYYMTKSTADALFEFLRNKTS